MRLIDADDLFKKFERNGWYDNRDRDDIAEELLCEAPTVDAEIVRHGKWIDINGGILYQCTNCNAQVNSMMFKSNLRYCHNCGAKME